MLYVVAIAVIAALVKTGIFYLDEENVTHTQSRTYRDAYGQNQNPVRHVFIPD